jgi:hypothetical protein
MIATSTDDLTSEIHEESQNPQTSVSCKLGYPQAALRRILRQGDVLLIEGEIPVSVRLEQGHDLVITSESGNAHMLKGVNVYSSASARYVQLYEPTQLEHPQHPPVFVPAGNFRVANVRERDVADSLFTHPRTQRTTPRD